MHNAREECIVRARAGARVRIEGARMAGSFTGRARSRIRSRIVQRQELPAAYRIRRARARAVILLRAFARRIVARPSRSQTLIKATQTGRRL